MKFYVLSKNIVKPTLETIVITSVLYQLHPRASVTNLCRFIKMQSFCFILISTVVYRCSKYAKYVLLHTPNNF